jgi:hypothetical protein
MNDLTSLLLTDELQKICSCRRAITLPHRFIFHFFYFVRKILIFGVDFLRKWSRMPQPDFTGRETERKEKKMMKTIAIVLGLTALTAAGNTLPPTPENTLPPTPEFAM